MARDMVNNRHLTLRFAQVEVTVTYCNNLTVAAGGFTKAQVKQWLFERATLPMSRFSKEGIERRFRRKLADQYANAPLEAPVRMVQNAEDLIVIVTGGAGKHSAYIPTFGNTRAVTRALKRADGELVKSIHELKRG